MPALLSTSSVDPARFYEFLREQPADQFAKAGIEGALWDAYCKHATTSAVRTSSRSNDGRFRQASRSGSSKRSTSCLNAFSRYVSEGYQRVKIKIQPGWDVEPVASVRAEFPQLPLMVDANAAYTIDDLHVFRELDRFGLMMIEQPLAANAIEEAGELQAHLTNAFVRRRVSGIVNGVGPVDRAPSSANHQHQSAARWRSQ